MKILYLCTFYHRAMLFRQQMDAMTRRGFTVKAFNTAQYGEGIAKKFLPIMDGEVIHLECWSRLDRLLFFPQQWKTEKQLQKHYALREFDLLHSHLLLRSGYSALRMKKKFGLPYVVSVRVSDLTGYIRLPFFRRMALDIIRGANGVLFISKCHQQVLESKYIPAGELAMFRRKSVLVGNCLEPFWQQNTAAPRLAAPDPQNLRIIAVAKIRAIKNLATAAKATQELRRRGINATLTVIGEVFEKGVARKLRTFDCVEMKPFMQKEELIAQYRTHDILLLPSIHETFGRVYAEAMTQGLPVLYSAGQGFDQRFADGEIGYAVPSKDPKAIADRVEDILHHYVAISAACIAGSKKFHEDAVMDQLAQFYTDAMTGDKHE